MPLRLVLLPALLATLAACAAAQGDGAPPANSRWRFVSIDNALPVTPSAQLRFEGRRLGINVGCNGMGGPWRVENGRLIAGPLVQTEMYCEGQVWNQERAVGALIAGAPELTLDNDKLTLRSRGHSAVLERVVRSRD